MWNLSLIIWIVGNFKGPQSDSRQQSLFQALKELTHFFSLWAEVMTSNGDWGPMQPPVTSKTWTVLFLLFLFRVIIYIDHEMQWKGDRFVKPKKWKKGSLAEKARWNILLFCTPLALSVTVQAQPGSVVVSSSYHQCNRVSVCAKLKLWIPHTTKIGVLEFWMQHELSATVLQKDFL